ncbi:DEAD/DEAH box helicase family protein [Methanoculleus caldifontis]|nr:DEAD/DEAH box helicase family protein [Methanoculleus sp. Wushi-C6]
MRRFLPHEIEYLSDPDRFTFDSFKRSVLDPLPPAAALGVADEELLNYYENALRQDGRFVLRLDPNGDHYERLERYVAETAFLLFWGRDGDGLPGERFEEFSRFRHLCYRTLHPFAESQKVAVLKKIGLETGLLPEIIDEVSTLFSVGSGLFAMELLARLTETGRADRFSARLEEADALMDLAARPALLCPLWPHQQRALEAWLRAGGRGILEMATASGKTLVGLAAALKLYEVHGRLEVLVLAHSRALLNQWRREAMEKLGLAGNPGADYTVPLEYGGRFVLRFETLQKVYRSPDRYRVDLLIVDEVHHGAGIQFRKALAVAAKWKMGLSATVEGEERRQPLDRALGPTVYTYTLKDAREDAVVPSFSLHLHTTYLDVRENEEFREISEQIVRELAVINGRHRDIIRRLSGSRFDRFASIAEFVGLMRHLRYRTAEVPEAWYRLIGLVYRRRMIIHRSAPKTGRAIELARHLGTTKKCIVFSMDIATCEAIYSALGETVEAYRVHSEMPRAEVQRSLSRFRSARYGVLVAPKMLDEGIDVPDAEIGINVASSKTRLQLVQRMGRILRKRPGKDPVFHHFVALPQAYVEAEDAFAYQGDLAWIRDTALLLDIPVLQTPDEDDGLAGVCRRSEAAVRDYLRSRRHVVADDFGTVRIDAILESIPERLRRDLAASLDSCPGDLTDEAWEAVVRSAWRTGEAPGLCGMHWLLVLAGRDPRALSGLLLTGLAPAPAAGAPPGRIRAESLVPPGRERPVEDTVRALARAAGPEQERAARRRLAEIGSPALPLLIPLLKSRNDEVVLRAIGAMEAIGDPAAIDLLIPHLSDRRYSVRVGAARALGRLGDPRARLALMRALKDREPEVRRAARAALDAMEGR